MKDDLLDPLRFLTREGHAAEFKLLARSVLALNDEIKSLREELKNAREEAKAAGTAPAKPSWKRPGAPTGAENGESEEPNEEGEGEAPAGPELPPGLGLFGG